MSNRELYQKMYAKMMEASEKAMEILEAAERECEELYVAACEEEEEK